MNPKPARQATTPEERARLAVYAARHVRAWGLSAAIRYCQRRDVPLSLFTTARQLHAIDAANFDVEDAQ